MAGEVRAAQVSYLFSVGGIQCLLHYEVVRDHARHLNRLIAQACW